MKLRKDRVRDRKFLKIDFMLFLSVSVMVVIGLVMVYSSSYYNLEIIKKMSPTIYFMKSVKYAAVGFFGMIVLTFINYENYKKYFPAIYIVTGILLILVLFLGKEYYGAKRWLNLAGFQFMPSEIAKISVVLCLSAVLTIIRESETEFNSKGHLAFVVLFSLIPILIYFERDYSTTALIAMLIFLMMFLANVDFKILITMISVGLFVSTLSIFKVGYRSSRVAIWLQTIFDRSYVFSDDRFQIMNSIYAVSSGGIKGKFIGMSDFKAARLPEAPSDFICAIWAEETGLIGSIFMLLLFIFIIYRIFRIAMRCEDRFGFMVAAGTGVLIALQVIINIGVVIAILPVTGIPLPFVSMGGTSLIVMLALIGIVLNISSKNLERS